MQPELTEPEGHRYVYHEGSKDPCPRGKMINEKAISADHAGRMDIEEQHGPTLSKFQDMMAMNPFNESSPGSHKNGLEGWAEEGCEQINLFPERTIVI